MIPDGIALERLCIFALIAAAGCGDGVDDRAVARAWLAYDTVVTVGHADENNPFLTFGRGTFALVDTSTMIHSASREAGRMVVVDLLAGTGWEVPRDAGAAGPGEFGGRQPLVSESGDTIHTAAGDTYNGFSLDGRLLATARFAQLDLGQMLQRTPVGFLGAGLVSIVVELPSTTESRSVHSRTLERNDPIRGERIAVDVGLPDLVTERVSHEGSMSFVPVAGNDFHVAARGGTLAVATLEEDRGAIRTYDVTGDQLAVVAVDERISSVRVDAQERVWVGVVVRNDRGELGRIVFDRELNELFRIWVDNLIDADGDMMLSLRTEPETGLQLLSLLRIRPGRP